MQEGGGGGHGLARNQLGYGRVPIHHGAPLPTPPGAAASAATGGPHHPPGGAAAAAIGQGPDFDFIGMGSWRTDEAEPPQGSNIHTSILQDLLDAENATPQHHHQNRPHGDPDPHPQLNPASQQQQQQRMHHRPPLPPHLHPAPHHARPQGQGGGARDQLQFSDVGCWVEYQYVGGQPPPQKEHISSLGIWHAMYGLCRSNSITSCTFWNCTDRVEEMVHYYATRSLYLAYLYDPYTRTATVLRSDAEPPWQTSADPTISLPPGNGSDLAFRARAATATSQPGAEPNKQAAMGVAPAMARRGWSEWGSAGHGFAPVGAASPRHSADADLAIAVPGPRSLHSGGGRLKRPPSSPTTQSTPSQRVRTDGGTWRPLMPSPSTSMTRVDSQLTDGDVMVFPSITENGGGGAAAPEHSRHYQTGTNSKPDRAEKACLGCHLRRKACDEKDPCSLCRKNSEKCRSNPAPQRHRNHLLDRIGCHYRPLYPLKRRGERLVLCSTEPARPSQDMLPADPEQCAHHLRIAAGRRQDAIQTTRSEGYLPAMAGLVLSVAVGLLRNVPVLSTSTCRPRPREETSYDQIIREIGWELDDNPEAARSLQLDPQGGPSGCPSAESLMHVLVAASHYEVGAAATVSQPLVGTSLLCLHQVLSALRLTAGRLLGPRTHRACAEDARPGCRIEPLRDLEERVGLYVDQFEKLLCKKGGLEQDRAWWLSMFYSLWIQAVVRRGLMAVQAEQGHRGEGSAAEYLKLLVVVFKFASKAFDPIFGEIPKPKRDPPLGETAESKRDVPSCLDAAYKTAIGLFRDGRLGGGSTDGAAVARSGHLLVRLFDMESELSEGVAGWMDR